MAILVSEIMNRELFAVRSEDHAEQVTSMLLGLGISAAPVLDDGGRPIGFVSLRDLSFAPAGARILARMQVPADVVTTTSTIQDAAALMIERSRHHLVCVDGDGRAVGFIGTLDVLRGLLGAPVPHPQAFPHFDAQSGLVWSDDQPLSTPAIESVPRLPGTFVLIDAQPGRPNRIVWSTNVDNLHNALLDVLRRPGDIPPHLVEAVASGRLWFRCAPMTAALP